MSIVHREPAALDCEFEARAVLGRAAAVAEKKRLVDFLDVDAALNGLDRVGDFEDAAAGFSGSAKGRGEVYFIRCPFLRARNLVELSALVAANLAGESRLDIGEAHSGQRPASIWIARPQMQCTRVFVAPLSRISPKVFLSSRGMRPILLRKFC